MRIPIRLAASVVVLLTLQLCQAQETPGIQEDAKFVAQLDLEAFGKTELGARLVDLTAKKAAEELGDGGENIVAQINEALGFDPLNEIRTITISGSDFDEPDRVQAVIQMGKTTGNLEGLLLTLPGYDSKEVGEHTIHSASEGGMSGFGAIHTDRSRNNWVVASTHEESLMAMLDSIRKGTHEGFSVPANCFAQVKLLEIPVEEFEDSPPANILKLLTDVSLTLSERDKSIAIDLKLTTAEEKKAEQIQQLVQGLAAMGSLVIENVDDIDDDDAATALQLLQGIRVQRDGSNITVGVEVPEELIINVLREEADLPL